ncbi:hypothetical protein PILCRDRAFT_543396 [Piloderma croceum F 1598]|uniref:Uncharacterized protein n=1 Tax=Piloderma croceum (strain F 1598) TaxID=765440 RepID=A0A0C3FJK9_PILCF|nr:hypothetical protein PILCRDRAFT_543396 [Piloderma croceum F 1598]
MEPVSVPKTKKDDAGNGKGRRPVVLGPLIEDEETIQDEDEQGNESRPIERKRHIRQLSATLSQTGPMVGETNDDEEEVDHLLDEDPSGRDEEEQESEDDAQIRRTLEHPGGGYKVPADEDQHSEGDEDESESESEDDLTKLQNKAKLRPNSAPNALTKTSRRYVHSSHLQPTPVSFKRHSTDRQRTRARDVFPSVGSAPIYEPPADTKASARRSCV